MAIRTMGAGFDSKAWERGEKQPMDVRYEGRVLKTGERNGYNDSDFYAIVFTEEGTFKHVEYASTRGWSYPNSATPDASDEIIEEARQASENARYAALVRNAENDTSHLKIVKGTRVRVVKGRKVPKGIEGEVFWVGEGNWGPRAGFNTDEGETYWIALKNLKSLAPKPPIDYERCRYYARVNANYEAEMWKKGRGRTF